MPVSVRNKEGKQTFLDEATAIMTSGYRNFKFIDEDWCQAWSLNAIRDVNKD